MDLPFMWEEGVCIYGIPEVPNNFPYIYIYIDYKAKEVLIFISTEVVSVSNRMAILQSIKYNWKILAMT